jgi:uncharacterized Fe-S center protein
MKKDVYFIKNSDDNKESARLLLDKLVQEASFKFNSEVAIKVHFGEKGNVTFVKPENYNGIIDYLEDQGVKSSFIETNVLYLGSRTTRDDHLAVAKDHGFTRIPIVIADGERGEAYSEVEINKEIFDKALIGKGFDDFNQIIVTAHFKGHEMAGFGGALKQLAMGFAARGGKLAQHSNNVPNIIEKGCVACNECAEQCPADAITVDDVARINPDTCIGCAACIPACPTKTIRIDWGANSHFYEKVAEYAYAAQKDKQFIYINFVTNITENCDCMGQVQHPVMADIGVMASFDPVALDQACFDIVKANKDICETSRLWDYFDNGLRTIEHCEKIGFGSKEYNLITIEK